MRTNFYKSTSTSSRAYSCYKLLSWLFCKLTACESTSLWMATVLIPRRLHELITRQAISPRLAINILLNCWNKIKCYSIFICSQYFAKLRVKRWGRRRRSCTPLQWSQTLKTNGEKCNLQILLHQTCHSSTSGRHREPSLWFSNLRQANRKNIRRS